MAPKSPSGDSNGDKYNVKFALNGEGKEKLALGVGATGAVGVGVCAVGAVATAGILGIVIIMWKCHHNGNGRQKSAA